MNHKQSHFHLYAIRKPSLRSGNDAPQPLIGSSHDLFAFAISAQPYHQHHSYHYIQAQLVQQQINKFGQLLFSFRRGQYIKIPNENVLTAFPISCLQQEQRYFLLQEQVRKFVVEFKGIMEHDQSQDQQYSRISSSQLHMQGLYGSHSIENRCRGRPRGSRNKRKESAQKSSEQQFVDESHKKTQEKRGRGRPKGAKNIKKQQFNPQLYQNELNIHQLFSNLFQTKSIQQINTKISRLKDKDDKLIVVKKQESEGQERVKRSRGRPKGVKNKPKMNNQESQSQQVQQMDNVPKRKTIKNNALLKCCSQCTQKQLTKQFLDGKEAVLDQLCNLDQHFSPQNHNNPIIYAIKSGNVELLKNVLERSKVKNRPFVLSWDANSRLQSSYYTVRTKKEFIAKGKRQGVHALLCDGLHGQGTWWKNIGLQRILQSIPHGIKGVEIYNILIAFQPSLKKQIQPNIASLVRCGNDALAYHLFQAVLKKQQNSTEYGYNNLHWQTLNKKKSELHFKKSLMVKQCCTANFCSPIHCLTINPNIQLLSYVLKHISDLNTGDSIGRKPIHYAAVLDSPKTMELLVKNGADLKEIDKRKNTPLMLATKFGRAKNVKYILDKVRDQQYINFKNEQGLAAVHFSVVQRHIDCFQIFLQDNLADKELETKQGMSLFHLAASTGQKQVLKLLNDKQYYPQPDNFRRTALMLAIRNHQNDCFFYLFNSAIRYYRRDYSYNTMLHYAAAYGNLEIVKYLLELGTVQTMNRKKFYPFQIAVLKGHYQCAKLLQNWTLHYSHHLPNRLSKNPRATEQFYQMFEYLLQTKKYDLNYKNPSVYGYTCLHFVCSIGEQQYYRLRNKENSCVKEGEYAQMQQKLISMLLKYDANDQVENQRGEKPLKLCIQNQNLTGIQLLLRDIPFQLLPNRSYIYYLTKIACLGHAQMNFVFQKLVSTDQKILKNELKKVDTNGFQFLIYLVKKFTQSVHNNFKNKYIESYHQEQDEDKAVLIAFQDYIKHEEILIKTINYLVEMGADPKFTVSQPRMDEEYQNYKKWGIQHFLMRFPSPNLLRIFMKWIDTNFNLQNSEGRTPLHLFCMWNHQANIFNRQGDGLPPIDLQEMRSFSGLQCMQYLLENGLTSNVLDINRSTPLLYAAIRKQLAFIRLLRNFGSTINNVNSLNQVPLIELIHQKQHLSLTQFQNLLLDQGLRSDFNDSNQRNALHHLVSVANNFDNSPEICKKLLEYGVGINSFDKFGRSPIFYCFIKIQEKQVDSPPNPTTNDKVQILQTLLAHPDINLNVIDLFQRTPLHYACEKGFFFSILYLLQKIRQTDIEDSQGNTPLAICLKNKNLNQAAMLIKKGVDYGFVVQDGVKMSYVQYSLKKLPVGICFMLIEHGFPLQKALEEAGDLKSILVKKYVK